MWMCVQGMGRTCVVTTMASAAASAAAHLPAHDPPSSQAVHNHEKGLPLVDAMIALAQIRSNRVVEAVVTHDIMPTLPPPSPGPGGLKTGPVQHLIDAAAPRLRINGLSLAHFEQVASATQIVAAPNK